jgi:hypothetical protein
MARTKKQAFMLKLVKRCKSLEAETKSVLDIPTMEPEDLLLDEILISLREINRTLDRYLLVKPYDQGEGQISSN